MSIEINKIHSINQVEALLSGYDKFERAYDLQLANDIDTDGMGVLPALIQFLITWSKKHNNTKLILYPNKQNLEEIRLKDYLYYNQISIGCLLAKAIFLRSRDGLDVTKKIKNELEQELKASNGCSLIGLESSYTPSLGFMYLLSDDHPWLYSKDIYSAREDILKFHGFQYIGPILKERIKRTLTKSETVSPKFLEGADAIIEIIYELLLNTEEWARFNPQEKTEIHPSIRGLLVRKIPLSSLSSAMKSCESVFKNYLSNFSDDPEFNGIIEFSVFDSGVGLAKRYLADKYTSGISIGDEQKAVHSCFLRHRTSSQSSVKGLGLYHVLSSLRTKKCFMRLRTGRLNCYQNFLEPANSQSDLSIRDWVNNEYIMQSHADVSGALYTFLFPVFK